MFISHLYRFCCSTDRTYDIEFNGYLSNHVKHAVIALDRLEAGDARVQEYWNDYVQLTPYTLQLHKVDQDWETMLPSIQDDAEWSELRGKKRKWQEQVVYMNEQLLTRKKYNCDTNKLVQSYAPDLLSGIAGALTHGIIHLGWAIEAKSPWMICEGLAYLNFCHLGVAPAKLKPSVYADTLPIESYVRVAKTFESDDLQTKWVDRAKAAHDEGFHPELVPSGFQWHAAKVMHDAHSVATDLPSWLDDAEIDQLWECMYYAVVWLYLATRSKEDGHGSFLVLHLMTSLWGLEHVCRTIDDDTVTRDALGQFYATSLCLLAASGGFPAESALREIQTEVPLDLDDATAEWEPIVTKGIAETEEHNIKLVYVMKELWKRYGHWSGFVEAAKAFNLTPDIGPNNTAFVVDS